MLTDLAPGIYIEEIAGPRPIESVGTSTAGFVGVAPNASAHLNEVVALNNWSEFVRRFTSEGEHSTSLSHAVYGFFLNGGSRCYVVNVGTNQPISGGGRERRGIDLFEQIDEIAIVAAPGYTDVASYNAVIDHCETLKDRVGILDPQPNVTNLNLLTQVGTIQAPAGEEEEGSSGEGADGLRPRQSDAGWATFYFPWLIIRDPLSPEGEQVAAPPSGFIAGIWARTDATRGVHKAPANEGIRGALGVTYPVTRSEQALLNRHGVNVIRSFSTEGIRVWGARTLAPSSSDFRYLNVRRLFAMVEESIAEGMRWAVFEPNDRTLWKSIRRDVSAFLNRLWRDGALMGRTAEEAFFVKCDEETNPPEEIAAGFVTTVIGMAPVKPAEFIVFRITQTSEGAETITE